jgi:hypothetical protein
MRTVTFADLSVIDDLKKNFILLWHNQSVDAFAMGGVQQKYTPEQVKAYPEGGGGGNVRTYFCTPDGKVLYYLQGFWRDERYRAEADFARQLAARAAAATKEDPALAVRKTLVARQGEIADLRRLMRERHPEEFKKKVYESEIQKRHAALGLLHDNLTAHNDLQMRPVQPILQEIWRNNTLRGEIR